LAVGSNLKKPEIFFKQFLLFLLTANCQLPTANYFLNYVLQNCHILTLMGLPDKKITIKKIIKLLILFNF